LVFRPYSTKKWTGCWEADHVEPVPHGERAAAAERLATLCRQDAARAGIREEDLETAAEDDLIANMEKVLDAAALRRDEAAN
jgi:hypothetical protein